MPKKIYLTGQRFGRLMVIKETYKDKYYQSKWICKCDCGKETIVYGSHLRSNRIKSCGCLMAEESSNRGKTSIRKTHKIDKVKNQKEGTRLSSLSEKLSKNNKSGVKGVTWDKNRCKWIAQIMLKGKNYNLGRFDELEDAIKARKEAEEKYFKPILEKYEKR